MADKQRFELFADFLTARFDAPRIFDVAGGMGKLNEALTQRGRSVLTFDRRHKHLPVEFAEREFTLEQDCDAGLLVGMHPDGATRIIIEYAARHGIGFAIVPCCSDNGMSYKPWMRHLKALAEAQGFANVVEESLPMRGRARVLYAQAPNRAVGG